MDTVSVMDTQALHERLGRVYHQPVNVSSFTNKRLTINFRSPIDRLQQLVPSHFEIEEIRDTGMGLISMCVCDFWVTKFGPVPVPKMHTNEMLCRISVKVPKQGQMHRAYYTLRSDSSSRILGFLGGHFSHFRKAISQFRKRDDGEVYELNCSANDAICNGHFKGQMQSVSKDRPATTTFANIEEATEFAFNLDGSCGYNFRSDLLSFQKIEYPKWDLYFCHEYKYNFALLNYLFKAYDLKAEFDCVLFMQKIPQVWGSSWMYKPDAPRITQQIETKVGIA
jgi:hypothetical protein